MLDFFRCRVMYIVCSFKDLRTQTLDRDLLNIFARKGAMRLTTGLSCAVGRKSTAQILSGSAQTAAVASSAVMD